jgi:hypothetical protein
MTPGEQAVTAYSQYGYIDLSVKDYLVLLLVSAGKALASVYFTDRLQA